MPYQRAIDAGYPVGGDLALGGSFAEAIYSGSGISDDDVLSAWQANSSDSLALLSTGFKDVGVGIAAANGLTYYVLNAGSDEAASTTGTPTSGSLTVTPGTVIPNTSLPNGEVYHIVQKNEALWSIAIAYETTIAELKLLNSLASDEIFEGQKLLIRRAPTETPTATEPPITVTLGIPTSTATHPATPTQTNTPTPVPTAPTSLQSGGTIVGGITLVALIAAALVAFLSRRKGSREEQSD
jgi:LysM repeat protein